MVKERRLPLTSRRALLSTIFSLSQIALSCVENDGAAITNRDTKTFSWQLPITHLLITVDFSITPSYAYISLPFVRAPKEAGWQ